MSVTLIAGLTRSVWREVEGCRVTDRSAREGTAGELRAHACHTWHISAWHGLQALEGLRAPSLRGALGLSGE